MTEFKEIDSTEVHFHDEDDDTLEMTAGWDGGLFLRTSDDGVSVREKDFSTFIKHVIRLSDVDGDFVEASGHEVETLFNELACGVGASRAVVTLHSPQAKAEIVEESARNLWAIAQVMRDNEERKAAEEENAVSPAALSYVSVADGARTTYNFPVVLDRSHPIFITKTGPLRTQVAGRAEGGRRVVYSLNPEDVTVVRPRPEVGYRVTVEKDAQTFYGGPSNFGGETVGTIIDIHEFDATVLGYSHTAKDFIEQQVGIDYLTPAEEPKIGDRVFVHRDAKTTDTSIGTYFGYAVAGTVVGQGYGMFKGDLHIETTDSRVKPRNRKQYVAPKWVAVLPPEVPEVGDRVLVPKDATTALGHPVFTTEKDIVAIVQSKVNSLGNIAVRTEDPFITTTYRQCVVDPKKVKVLEKAADIAAARAEVLKHGSVKFEDLPKELQAFVDEEIERKRK